LAKIIIEIDENDENYDKTDVELFVNRRKVSLAFYELERLRYSLTSDKRPHERLLEMYPVYEERVIIDWAGVPDKDGKTRMELVGYTDKKPNESDLDLSTFQGRRVSQPVKIIEAQDIVYEINDVLDGLEFLIED
jgi:hypothetical protein